MTDIEPQTATETTTKRPRGKRSDPVEAAPANTIEKGRTATVSTPDPTPLRDDAGEKPTTGGTINSLDAAFNARSLGPPHVAVWHPEPVGSQPIKIEIADDAPKRLIEVIQQAVQGYMGRTPVRVTRTAAPLPDGGDLEGAAIGPGIQPFTTRVRITYETDVPNKFVRPVATQE